MNPQDLFECLIQLNGLNSAKAADLAGIKRPNIYAWLARKKQVMSKEREERLFQTFGIINGRLSTDFVYRWRIEIGSICFVQVLKHLLPQEALDKAIIHLLEVENSGLYNALIIPQTEGDLILLVISNSPHFSGYPLTKEDIGFGSVGSKIYVPDWQWDKWWGNDKLEVRQFNAEADMLLRKQGESNQLWASDQPMDINLKAFYETQLLEKTAENAGLRALIRALLGEMRDAKLKSKLLQKEERDLRFKEFYSHELKKLRNIEEDI